MFSVELLEIPDQEKILNYDQDQIQWLQRSITFKNGRYHVQLSWHFDKLAQVPSNHAIALRILGCVVRGLEKKGLYQEYLDVFLQQGKEGLIEEIFVPPRRFGDYVWILHWPSLNLILQLLTWSWPVFNCSLKTGNLVFLNEAAYSGVNLSGDMLKLLLSFRNNEFVLLADIRKVFSMICLIAWRLTGRGFVFSLGMVTGFVVSDMLHSFSDSLAALLYLGVFWSFMQPGIP